MLKKSSNLLFLLFFSLVFLGCASKEELTKKESQVFQKKDDEAMSEKRAKFRNFIYKEFQFSKTNENEDVRGGLNTKSTSEPKDIYYYMLQKQGVIE